MIWYNRALQLILLTIFSGLLNNAGATSQRSLMPKPVYSEGTVFIYSNGDVEKLIEKGERQYIVENMRKRRYTRDNNFILPPLAYSSPSSRYTQKINSGNPDAIFPLNQSRSTGFSLKKDRPNRRQTIRTWSCTQAAAVNLKVMRKKKLVYKSSCTRYKWKKFYKIKEVQDIYYDPKTAWVVKRVVHKNGKEKGKRLVAVLPPDKASSRAITKYLRKIRRK